MQTVKRLRRGEEALDAHVDLASQRSQVMGAGAVAGGRAADLH